MKIANKHINNDLILNYVRIIKIPCPSDWTAWMSARVSAHAAIFAAARVGRDGDTAEDREFADALEAVVESMVK